MPLLPVLEEKLNAAVTAVPLPYLAPRDAGLPQVSRKVHAVIEMRRAGKTSYRLQLQAERRCTFAPE